MNGPIHVQDMFESFFTVQTAPTWSKMKKKKKTLQMGWLGFIISFTFPASVCEYINSWRWCECAESGLSGFWCAECGSLCISLPFLVPLFLCFLFFPSFLGEMGEIVCRKLWWIEDYVVFDLDPLLYFHADLDLGSRGCQSSLHNYCSLI